MPVLGKDRLLESLEGDSSEADQAAALSEAKRKSTRRRCLVISTAAAAAAVALSAVGFWAVARIAPVARPQDDATASEGVEEDLAVGGSLAAATDEVPIGVYGFCGITANPGLCDKEMIYLDSLSPSGSSGIFCKECGGNDPCSLDVSDADFGLNKHPGRCIWAPKVFFLWDQPDSLMPGSPEGGFGDAQCGVSGLPKCEAWAAGMWKKFVDKWGPDLESARRQGLRVSSPRFQGKDVLKKLAAFFAACPECSQKGSNYYIDVVAFNAWVANPQHDNGEMVADVAWIKATASTLKTSYGNRPVILTDFGSLGADSAALQADVIENSGLFERGSSSLDAVYYFAAVNYKNKNNFVEDAVTSGPRNGRTLGQVLLDKCPRGEASLASQG